MAVSSSVVSANTSARLGITLMRRSETAAGRRSSTGLRTHASPLQLSLALRLRVEITGELRIGDFAQPDSSGQTRGAVCSALVEA
ncbi:MULTISPECIES: hypothetical protein [unclassified Sphingobium]|uniref:hypothetical protein n=1 Tax=unclassified Sphingobium TaxID=2611147 RepID=UPI0011AA33DE|nr:MULTISPECIES: hypothetical protein [unclassified Sphingobium]MBG6116526.1 hypothetical protein [Sphingobium sp. JAI105]